MKILFIAAPFPYPPDTGSRNLIFHWLGAACRKHDVDLITIEENGAGDRRIPELPNLRIEVLPVSVERTSAARIARFAVSVVRGIPANSLVYMPRDVEQRVRERVRGRSYHAVVLTENVIAGFVTALAPWVAVVLFKHSVQAVDARDARRRHGMWAARWMLSEWIVRRFEARTCRAAGVICCVNQEDADDLVRRYALPRAPEVVPIGVELGRFQRRLADPGGATIGFYGNLAWGANADAVAWFANRILPQVWREHPEAIFRIVGPGSEVLPIPRNDPRIVRLGAVPQQEIPVVMRDVTVGVVPVISGTGVRLKLLEMLSMGIPTVSTSLGILGTHCEDGAHLLVADEPAAFAAAVSRLLSNVALRKRLSNAGAEIAPSHAWENSHSKIFSVIELAACAQERFSGVEPKPRMETS